MMYHRINFNYYAKYEYARVVVLEILKLESVEYRYGRYPLLLKSQNYAKSSHGNSFEHFGIL